MTKFSQYSFLLQLYQQRCTIQNLLISIFHNMVTDQFCCISWLTSFFRPSILLPPPSTTLLSSHHPYQQSLFPFPVIHPTSTLFILNNRQNTIINSSQILFLFHFMNNITHSTSLPPLPSPPFEHTGNPTHHLASILSKNSFPFLSHSTS